MGTVLDRRDIIDGLRDLIAELHAAGEVAGIRLVGGAALALRYFDRGTTQTGVKDPSDHVDRPFGEQVAGIEVLVQFLGGATRRFTAPTTACCATFSSGRGGGQRGTGSGHPVYASAR